MSGAIAPNTLCSSGPRLLAKWPMEANAVLSGPSSGLTALLATDSRPCSMWWKEAYSGPRDFFVPISSAAPNAIPASAPPDANRAGSPASSAATPAPSTGPIPEMNPVPAWAPPASAVCAICGPKLCFMSARSTASFAVAAAVSILTFSSG